VAGILGQYGDDFLEGHKVSYQKRKVIRAIVNCRTAVLGGHLQGCSDCGNRQIAYNSCRNRHCPKCQVQQREKWIRARTEQVLPVPYFHVVFTIPSELNQLCLAYPKQLYNILFSASWKTLTVFSNDPGHLGARSGMTSILHTWGQNLSLHPHVHCLVPSGGIDRQGKWKEGRGKGKYLFPVKAMGQVFRGVFLKQLKLLKNKVEIDYADLQGLVDSLFKKQWVVYAKRPFAGAASVIEYLGRYSHKVAISNHRIKAIEDKKVYFDYKNYRTGQSSVMHLGTQEFIRRFAQHILSKGFVRIRHFGICAARRKVLLTIIKDRLLEQSPLETISFSYPQWSKRPIICPKCQEGIMKNIRIVLPIRAGPW
jgi:hypothetical protein